MIQKLLSGFKADFKKVKPSEINHSENVIVFQDDYTIISLDKNDTHLFITTIRPGKISENYFTVDGKFKPRTHRLYGIVPVSRLKTWKRRRKKPRVIKPKTSKIIVSHVVNFYDNPEGPLIKIIHQRAGLTRVYSFISDIPQLEEPFSNRGNLENIFYSQQQMVYRNFLKEFRVKIPAILMGNREDAENYCEGWDESDLRQFVDTWFEFKES